LRRAIATRAGREVTDGNGLRVTPTGTGEPGPEVPFTPEAAEADYQALGRFTGKLAAAPVQAAAREFWVSSGERGARWLARRLHWEFHVDTLHAPSAQLADLGEAAIGPIVEELGGHPTPEQAEALLKALGWIGESPSALIIEATAFELLLARFLQHRDPDVREGAALAMRLLPSARAAYWLRRRQLEERDKYVTPTIEDELTRHQSSGG
jgi:hypothetical protein